MINLSSLPGEAQFNQHYHCDFVEMLALVSNADTVSVSDVISRYLGADILEDQEAFIGQEEVTQGDSGYSTKQDKLESRVYGLFSILISRQQEFGDIYPFLIENDKIKLRDDLSHKNSAYLLMLLSSSLRYIKRDYHSYLTTDFEEISLRAIKKYLSPISETHRFGKSRDANERYVGHIKDKIDLFAQDIGLETRYKDHFFSDKDYGDGGLDIVAWSPFFNDPCKQSIQVYLGQCATGKDWLCKQYEPLKIKNSISGLDNPVVMMFMPYDGRNEDRSLNEEARITTSLLFDRFRLLALLEDELDFVSELRSYVEVVCKAVVFEEAIV